MVNLMVILMLSGMSYYGMMNGKLYLDFDKVNLFVIYFWKNRGEKNGMFIENYYRFFIK